MTYNIKPGECHFTIRQSRNEGRLPGVFPMNYLPNRVLNRPLLFIVNTNSSNVPGQHWKPVFISTDWRLEEIFDSLVFTVGLSQQRWMSKHATGPSRD